MKLRHTENLDSFRDNFIKVLVMDSVKAEIIESSQTTEMLLGKRKIYVFCFGFDQHILIVFYEKESRLLKEGTRL